MMSLKNPGDGLIDSLTDANRVLACLANCSPPALRCELDLASDM